MSTNVLVIGSGGREHALAWKIAQSPQLGSLYVAPGNGGTQELAENVPIQPLEFDKLMRFAERHHIDLTVIGPDDPLAAGIVDHFKSRSLPIFGPTQRAAQIEASKVFAKALMAAEGIPTASYRAFSDYDDALRYVRQHGPPVVIKADGLALGKGVYMCRTEDDARRALENILVTGVHGRAGSRVIIEDLLEGCEVSIHALCDGKTSLLFPSSQDYKRAFDNDEGPNTGGMGTVAPVPFVSDAAMHEICQQIVRPLIQLLRLRKIPFTGCLYPGLMMTREGPQVLEFNARFGDPETQAYVRLMDFDLLTALEACIQAQLAQFSLTWRKGYAACIVLASGGYPGAYRKGIPIAGVSEALRMTDVVIFHAGTRRLKRLRTAGGRVLNVTATAETLQGALDKAYEAARCIKFNGMYYRTDIGSHAFDQRP